MPLVTPRPHDPVRQETLPTSLEEEMRRSYLDYAMSVIVGRALPDARDGLKPVHRRSLRDARELNNDWNQPYKKSARIVGDVIGKIYHPHGDQSVYDTIVRMAQDFSLRHMLVDGQGNFGSVDGDNAAACATPRSGWRRSRHEMLADIDGNGRLRPQLRRLRRSRWCCRPGCPTCSSTARAASRWAWRRTSRPQPQRVADACLHLLKNPAATVDR